MPSGNSQPEAILFSSGGWGISSYIEKFKFKNVQCFERFTV